MKNCPLKTDAVVVEEVLAGNKDTYIVLMERYQGRLRSILSAFCYSADEVETCLQEAFVRAYLSLEQYDTARSFFPWLKTIAINGLRNSIHKRVSETRRAEEYLRNVRMAALENDPSGKEVEERSAALNSCMEKLAPSSASLIRERYSEGRNLVGLSKRFKLSVNTIAVRLHRVRQGLKGCIDRYMETAGSV